jgi:hypothetical protein
LSAPAIIANLIAERGLVLFLPCDWRFLPKLGLRDNSRSPFFSPVQLHRKAISAAQSGDSGRNLAKIDAALQLYCSDTETERRHRSDQPITTMPWRPNPPHTTPVNKA